MAKDTSYWRQFDEVSLASHRGFIGIEQIPVLLYEAYPDLRQYVFGFFVKTDLPNRLAGRWVHFTPEWMPDKDREAFNNAIEAGRFGITKDVEGHLMFERNYICIKSREYREREIEKRRELSAKNRRTRVSDGVQSESDVGPLTVEVADNWKTTVNQKRGRPKKT